MVSWRLGWGAAQAPRAGEHHFDCSLCSLPPGWEPRAGGTAHYAPRRFPCGVFWEGLLLRAATNYGTATAFGSRCTNPLVPPGSCATMLRCPLLASARGGS